MGISLGSFGFQPVGRLKKSKMHEHDSINRYSAQEKSLAAAKPFKTNAYQDAKIYISPSSADGP